MDQPHSHITPAPALRSDNTPGPHPGLSFPLRALLKGRYWKLREEGNVAMADALARLASASEVAGAVNELNRRLDALERNPLLGNYLRPTIDALLWRDPQLRKLLRANRQDRHKLPAFRCAARDEYTWRACIIVEILSELAKMTTQFPDERAVAKVAERGRTAVEEWQAAKTLRAGGFPKQAAMHALLADRHLIRARILARECAGEHRDKLLRMTSWRLARHFGFNGYQIAAAWVSAALELKVPISPRHTRHVVEKFLRREK